jgi:hypothetical protein
MAALGPEAAADGGAAGGARRIGAEISRRTSPAGDGKTVLIHTFACGLYQMDGIDTEHPSVRHVKTFAGKQCDVPDSFICGGVTSSRRMAR